MIIYALVAIMPLLFSFFFPKVNDNPKRKRKYLILCGIVLVLFMGLRSKFVGSEDCVNYYNMMNRAIVRETWAEFYNPDGVETGFQLFIFTISRLFNNAQMVFVVSAIIITASVFYTIYKNSENVVLSVVMFITLGIMQFQMQGMRQAVAMAVCMVAFEFVKKKKIIPFILLVVFAMQFHRTAIVFIIIYFVALMPYKWWSMLLLAIGSGVVFAYTESLMIFANDLFESDYAQTIDSGGFVATAIYVLIIGFAMVFNQRALHNKVERTASTVMFLTIIGFASYVMRYFGAGISERISFYFMFGQIILLPNTIKHIPAEYRKITNMAVYLLCIALFIYRLRGSDFIPYEFFWNVL